MYRDKLLEQARAVFDAENLEKEQLEDHRIIELDDMMADPTIFPPIT